MGDNGPVSGNFEAVELFGAGEAMADRASKALETTTHPASSGMVVSERRLRQVEQFLFMQSELLDSRAWQDYIDLFTDDGIYWIPALPSQQEWRDTPSICIEDKALMSVRMGRLLHPNAWSLAGLWVTSHVVGNVVVEADDCGRIAVRSRFHMFEQRRDVARQFAGVYRHTLIDSGRELRVKEQRVDLVNAQAPFEYVIQAWI